MNRLKHTPINSSGQAPCPRCGHAETREAPGKGPHHRSEVCARCGRFRRWLPKPRVIRPPTAAKPPAPVQLLDDGLFPDGATADDLAAIESFAELIDARRRGDVPAGRRARLDLRDAGWLVTACEPGGGRP
jgi:hypothetical protein